MSKRRQSDEELITQWFNAADPEAVKVMFRVLKGIVEYRNIAVGQPKAVKAKPRVARLDKGTKRGLPDAQKANGGDNDGDTA